MTSPMKRREQETVQDTTTEVQLLVPVFLGENRVPPNFRMNKSDSKVTEGGLNVTLTIRLLMHGKEKISFTKPFAQMVWVSLTSCCSVME
ncbi:hypothetical protein scyTo_0012223, partial [Scyliorhinus torazame]|nr:hypothetical protein [Scyliorhinus torazame]